MWLSVRWTVSSLSGPSGQSVLRPAVYKVRKLCFLSQRRTFLWFYVYVTKLQRISIVDLDVPLKNSSIPGIKVLQHHVLELDKLASIYFKKWAHPQKKKISWQSFSITNKKVLRRLNEFCSFTKTSLPWESFRITKYKSFAVWTHFSSFTKTPSTLGKFQDHKIKVLRSWN